VVLKATEAALAVLKATEAAALADVGHLNLRRSLLATLTSVVVAARGDVGGVGVLWVWMKHRLVVLSSSIPSVMQLNRRIIHT
jgi:hypothetical protein